MVRLKSEGVRPAEIARKLGIGRASVYRVLTDREKAAAEPSRSATAKVGSFHRGTRKMSRFSISRGILWPAAIVIVLVVALGNNAHARGCGGAERWLIKVATDDLAASVDPANVSDTTVAELNNEPRPRGANGAGDTRLPEEMSLASVKGFIRFIKLERDDNDFHLVITDTADAEFTPAGTGSRPTGTSLIAEAPNPDCVSGRNGDGPTKSLFQGNLEDVRKSIACNMEGLMDQEVSEPVLITGIRFFDFPHGQIGRAKNVIEIHPIMGIEFKNLAQGCSNAPYIRPQRPVG